MGYAGGTTADPTYRRIGDHAETVQVDFDPSVVTYPDLLALFWTSHRPLTPAPSRQYASFVFTRDDGQQEHAEASLEDMRRRFGRVYTEVTSLVRFYPAEDYHQKYRLRADRVLMAEIGAVYAEPQAFRESTAAARLNGYLDGWGTGTDLAGEIASFGLSADAQEYLRQRVVAVSGG